LKKEQFKALKDAGITVVEAGIESLSSDILHHMGKGTTALENIQCLKWCKQFEIKIYWNMLWGFPFESADAYADVAKVIPLISHLQPPEHCTQVALMRFSPLFERWKEFGLTNIRPAGAYKHIYPFENEVVTNLSTYFSYDYITPRDVDQYTQEVKTAIEQWKNAHQYSEMISIDYGDRLLIWDQRLAGTERLGELTGLERAVFIACDGAKSFKKLNKTVRCQFGLEPEIAQLEKTLQSMITRRLILEDGQMFLSLAIPATTPSKRLAVQRRIENYFENARKAHYRRALRVRTKLKPMASNK
jgi:hypothetical protein